MKLVLNYTAEYQISEFHGFFMDLAQRANDCLDEDCGGDGITLRGMAIHQPSEVAYFTNVSAARAFEKHLSEDNNYIKFAALCYFSAFEDAEENQWFNAAVRCSLRAIKYYNLVRDDCNLFLCTERLKLFIENLDRLS